MKTRIVVWTGDDFRASIWEDNTEEGYQELCKAMEYLHTDEAACLSFDGWRSSRIIIPKSIIEKSIISIEVKRDENEK